MTKASVLFLLCLSVFLRAEAAANPDSSGCPKIISKTEWGGKSASRVLAVNASVPYVLIHHTATGRCNTVTECQAQILSIQNEHIKRKWDDIGYNFLVDDIDHIYEGRGWRVHGAHSPNFNSKSVGIAVIGNYMKQKVSASTVKLIQRLIECGVSGGHISGNYKLLGHRQTRATLCPGNELYNELIRWPHWVPRP